MEEATLSEEALTIERDKRMRAPLLWARMECENATYRIEDLQESRFEEAISFIKAHYLKHEILMQATNMKTDEQSINDFCRRCLSDMRDCSSLVALNEGTNRMVGVTVNRVMSDEDHAKMFVKALDQMVTGKTLSEIYKFHQKMEFESALYKKLPSYHFMKIRLIATRHRLKPDIKRMADEMLKASLILAEFLDIQAVSAIFTSTKDQQMARRLGFTDIYNIYYLHYIVNEEAIFEEAKYPNFGACVFGIKIPVKEKRLYSLDQPEPPVEEAPKKKKRYYTPKS